MCVSVCSVQPLEARVESESEAAGPGAAWKVEILIKENLVMKGRCLAELPCVAVVSTQPAHGQRAPGQAGCSGEIRPLPLFLISVWFLSVTHQGCARSPWPQG